MCVLGHVSTQQIGPILDRATADDGEALPEGMVWLIRRQLDLMGIAENEEFDCDFEQASVG